MKTILFTFLALASFQSFAGTINCATAMGGYDEVQKFQIVDNKYVVLNTKKTDSSCFKKNRTLKCDFLADRLRSYSVVLNLDTLEGEIDQAFRSKHSISCSRE